MVDATHSWRLYRGGRGESTDDLLWESAVSGVELDSLAETPRNSFLNNAPLPMPTTVLDPSAPSRRRGVGTQFRAAQRRLVKALVRFRARTVPTSSEPVLKAPGPTASSGSMWMTVS